MRRRICRPVRVACFCGALVLALNAGRGAPLARDEETIQVGFGEATAAPFIAYVGHDGLIRSVPSVAAVGNRISFSLIARRLF